MRAFIFILMLFAIVVPSDVVAFDICDEVRNNPEVEAHFATTMAREYTTSVDGKLVRYAPNGSSMGTCYSEKLGVGIEWAELETIGLRCPSDEGCAWGREGWVVEWKGMHYLVNSRINYRSKFPRNIHVWEHLSEKQQKMIAFRNTTSELYIINQDRSADFKCDFRSVSREYVEKSLVDSPLCDSLAYDKVTSIFSTDDSSHRVMGVVYDPQPRVMIDIDNDGKKEILAILDVTSGAGCGGSYQTVGLLAEKVEGEHAKVIARNPFGVEIGWDQYADIVSNHNGELYFSVNLRSLWGQLRSRALYPLSTDSSLKPVCSYVNEAPVSWIKLDQ